MFLDIKYILSNIKLKPAVIKTCETPAVKHYEER